MDSGDIGISGASVKSEIKITKTTGFVIFFYFILVIALMVLYGVLFSSNDSAGKKAGKLTVWIINFILTLYVLFEESKGHYISNSSLIILMSLGIGSSLITIFL